MGSTSFWGFSYPNLLLVFLNLLSFRDLYHIFLASVGTLSESFFILSLFYCTLFWVIDCDDGNSFPYDSVLL